MFIRNRDELIVHWVGQKGTVRNVGSGENGGIGSDGSD